MDGMIPLLAGAVSTVIFAGGTLPMLVKAARTKDLSSYSLGNIGLSNVGNVIQSIYVFHLPAGPMWVLHTFYLLSTALMLYWYLRYTPSPILGRRPGWWVRPTRYGPPGPSVLGQAVGPHGPRGGDMTSELGSDLGPERWLLEAGGLVPGSRLRGIRVVLLGDQVPVEVLAVDGQALEGLTLIAGGQRVGGDAVSLTRARLCSRSALSTVLCRRHLGSVPLISRYQGTRVPSSRSDLTLCPSGGGTQATRWQVGNARDGTHRTGQLVRARGHNEVPAGAVNQRS